jgi:hypothetical protein
MESLLASTPVEERVGFWRRECPAMLTRRQSLFDVIFGILLPLFCFYFDFGLVRSSGELLHWQLIQFSGLGPWIYALSGLVILTLILWLAVENQINSIVRAGLSGVLFAGGIVSTAIGVMISLPFIAFGAFFLVVLVGFVPFFTGFVYVRNGLRALGIFNFEVNRVPRIAIAVFSLFIAFGVPSVVQWKVSASINQSFAEIVDLNSASIDAPLARIKLFQLLIDPDPIIQQYQEESNTMRKERLGRVYKEIAGEDIERRIAIIRD